MNSTKIEYCDASWNPTTGCTPEFDCWKICWARKMAARMAANPGVKHRERYEGFKPTFWPERLDEPLRIKKPRRIAVSFMGDLFHKDVPWQWQKDILSTAFVAHKLRGHTFLFLTKRPSAMCQTVATWLESADFGILPRQIPDGFWFGTSVANQADADERLPELLQCPGNLWVSIEPMKGSVGLARHFPSVYGRRNDRFWVVIGGGPFPVNPDWLRSVREQCAAAGVPFFMKQMDHRKPIPDDLQIREFPYSKKGGNQTL